MDKLYNFPLNSIRMQQEHYFRDINYYMLKKINRHPEGGGHRSMSTPLNTPLLGLYINVGLQHIRPTLEASKIKNILGSANSKFQHYEHYHL